MPAPGERESAHGVDKYGFGIPAIKPQAAAVDPATPTITRADVEHYLASVNLSMASLSSTGPVRLLDFQCGPVAVIQALLPSTAPPLVDVPPLICMASVRGNFAVHQPGGPPAPGSMLYVLFDGLTGNLVAVMC
jgi:hypothetical protein